MTRILPGSQVVVILNAYLPGYKAGGPIRTIENLVLALGSEFRFRIVTVDRDIGDRSPYQDIAVNRWLRVGKAEVMYLRPHFGGALRLYKLLHSLNPDTVLYLNTFFGRRASLLPVLMRWLKMCRAKCLVLAPRGELSPGAMQLKPMRKQFYISIARWLVYRNILWHASSEFEASDILRTLQASAQADVAPVLPKIGPLKLTRLDGEVAIASDLFQSSAIPSIIRSRKTRGRLHAVSVGRLSRMKNAKTALSLLRGISGSVAFDIYGPLEDLNYWDECKEVIAGLPENIKVRYCGEVEHKM